MNAVDNIRKFEQPEMFERFMWDTRLWNKDVIDTIVSLHNAKFTHIDVYLKSCLLDNASDDRLLGLTLDDNDAIEHVKRLVHEGKGTVRDQEYYAYYLIRSQRQDIHGTVADVDPSMT